MEVLSVVCLLLAGAILIALKGSPVAEGAVLGIFVALVLLLVSPLVSLAAKTADMKLGLMTALMLTKELGWIFILVPVAMFFLAHFKIMPMKFREFLGANLAFTLCYTVLVGVMIFRDIWMMILSVVCIFSIVSLVTAALNLAINARSSFEDASSPQGDGVDGDSAHTRLGLR